MRRVTLVGYRASGKTTVGRRLAQRLGWPWVDADAALAEAVGMPAGAFLRAHGEPAFRDAEAACLERLLSGDAPLVLATGGGAVVRAANRALLAARGGTVAWLRVPVATLVARLTREAGDRPTLTGAGVAEEVPRLLAEREPWYRAVATLEVDATAPAPEVARRIAARLRGGESAA